MNHSVSQIDLPPVKTFYNPGTYETAYREPSIATIIIGQILVDNIKVHSTQCKERFTTLEAIII